MRTDTVELDAAPAVANPMPGEAGLRLAALDAADAQGTPLADLGEAPVRVHRSDLAPFALIGFSWTRTPAGHPDAAAAHDGHVHGRVRVHTEAGWSPWHAVDTSEWGDEAGLPGRIATEPVWVGEADAFDLWLDAEPDGLAVHLVRAEDGTGGAPAGDADADADAPTIAPFELAAATAAIAPTVHTRAEWGARPTGPLDAAHEVRLAVVHHTGDATPYGEADVPAILRAIQAYHVDANGWDDIGYNFVVDRFGRVWEGRAGGLNLPIVGAHAYGLNTSSVGVAVLGDFTSVAASEAAVSAVVDVIAWKLFLSGSDPHDQVDVVPFASERLPEGVPSTIERIVGHGQLNLTGCPGSLLERLDEIRARVAQRYDSFVGTGAPRDRAVGTPPAGATALVGDFDGNGNDDVLWHSADSATKTFWFGRADGTFAVATRDAPVAHHGLVGDFDGNGVDDVFWWSTRPEDGDVIWLQQPGGAEVAREQPYDSPHTPSVADTDGDGDDDLVLYHPRTGATTVWASLGPRGFRPAPVVGAPGAELTVGDFSGDGRADLFWYGPGAAVDRYQRSEGTTRSITTELEAGGSHTVTSGDLDGDGADDLIFSGDGARIDIWWGRGFGSGARLDAPAGHRVVAADLSGGGADELYVIAPGGTVEVWTVDENRTPSVHPLGDVPARSVVAGDFDGDGRTDLLWYPDGSGGTPRLWLGS